MGVPFGVMLARFLAVMSCMIVVTVGDVRMVACLLVITSFVVFCSGEMVLGGVFVVFCRFPVVFCSFVGHELTPPVTQSSRQRYSPHVTAEASSWKKL